MGLEERVYSVLVVSAGESFNSALSALLPRVFFFPDLFCSQRQYCQTGGR